MTDRMIGNGFQIQHEEKYVIVKDTKSGQTHYLSKTTFDHLKELLKDSPYGLRDRRLMDYSDFVIDGSGKQIKMRWTVGSLIEHWYSAL